MGKLNQSAEPLSITHFSHLHPLQIFNPQPSYQTLAACSGCQLNLSPGGGSVYCCSTCSFFLHASCAKLPLQITHPADQYHALSLLPSPIYPQGFFNCDACGKRGNGFSYHCRPCNIDLHTSCASMPMAQMLPSHPHQLNLTFCPPYPNKSFSCDICRNPGSSHWLYRCHPCEQPAATNVQQVRQINLQNYGTYPQNPTIQQQPFNNPMMTMPVQCYPAQTTQHVQMNVPMDMRTRQLVGNNNSSNQLQSLFGVRNSPNLTRVVLQCFLGGFATGSSNAGGSGGGAGAVDGSGNDGTPNFGGGGDGGGFDLGGSADFGNFGGFGDTSSIGGFEDIGGLGDFSF